MDDSEPDEVEITIQRIFKLADQVLAGQGRDNQEKALAYCINYLKFFGRSTWDDEKIQKDKTGRMQTAAAIRADFPHISL